MTNPIDMLPSPI